MFKNVIVRTPAKSIVNGITSAPELGKPDYNKALIQHESYIQALKNCGCQVEVLPSLEDFPDSCFVEDVAVLTERVAIITRPGAETRLHEVDHIKDTLRKYYEEDCIEEIESPGTLEGGDVMMVGNHFYVGQSDRTNEEGCKQFIDRLKKYGHEGTVVKLEEFLHLKTGVNYLENNNLLVSGEFIDNPLFKEFNQHIIPDDEMYAANCIWVNNTVIVPKGYPKVLSLVKSLGYKTIEVDTSEFRKLDGGLSCLSLRFEAQK